MSQPTDMKISLLEQGHFEFLEGSVPEEGTKPKKAKTASKTQAIEAPTNPTPKATTKALVSHRTGKPRVFKGKKHIISVSIAPHVLAKVDEWASQRGMSRPAAIAFALNLLPD